MVKLSTRVLVACSNLISRWWPPNLDRYEDELSYSRWQMGNAVGSYDRLYAPVRSFQGQRILDLGSGEGGKTTYYSSKGPMLIVGIDIDAGKISRAKAFSREQGQGEACHFLVGSAQHCPFVPGSFDTVISEDCFDHYSDVEGVLREVHDLLRPAGVLLARFDTYYNWGGSHLYNFVRVPWAHLIFSDQALIEATRIVSARFAARDPGGRRRETYAEQAEREIHQFRYFVNRISLCRWRKLLRRQGWKVVVEDTQCTGRKIPVFNLPVLDELYNSLFYVLQK